MSEVIATYEIPETNLAYVNEKIEKLNKRARRLGVDWITLVEVGTDTREILVKGEIQTRLVHLMEVHGVAPKLSGWKFIATLDHTVVTADNKEANVVIRTIPGETVPTTLRCDDAMCDHCNVRRFRLETFILRNEQGEIVRVGRTCLKDFLGGNDPHKYAQYAVFLGDINELLGHASDYHGVGGNYVGWSLDEYLAWVAAEIRVHGWVSGGMAYERGGMSSANAALTTMVHRGNRDGDLWPTADDRVLAEEAIEWIRQVRAEATEDLNDYMHNLSVVCASDVVVSKNAGIAGSLLTTFMRARERRIMAERAARLAETSQYVGKIKERLRGLRVTVTNMVTRESHFGTTTIVTMTDGANSFTWFASSVCSQMKQGATLVIDGTVHKHETFRDVATTYLKRVSVKEVVEAA